MDNAIKEAISRKRGKAAMDPAFDVKETDQHLDEQDHADLAPDVHNSHVNAEGNRQNVNPTRPDKAGFKSEDNEHEDARDGKSEHIYPQDNFTDPTKQPRKFNDKNIGRMMSGDGTDPQHDTEGVDTHAKDLKIDSPANMGNHSKSEAMTHAVARSVGSKEGLGKELGEGDKPDGDGSDAMKTAKAQMNNQMTPGSKLRGGLQQGANDNNRYAHKPMAGANAKMRSKY